MIAQLNIHENYRPSWFDVSLPAHIPLPHQPENELTGTVIVWGTVGAKKLPLLSDHNGKIQSQYPWPTWKTFILSEAYRTLNRPAYTYLPFHYHRIPGWARQWGGKFYTSRQNTTQQSHQDFPGFPIEQGFEALSAIYEQTSSIKTVSPIVLTHDVDTAEGLKMVAEIARLEMDHGFRSLWNVVGCRYRHDDRLLDWLKAKGFEIGLHGYNHDNKLIFLSESNIRRRLEQCRKLIDTYQIKSFRSPSWFRSDRLFGVLKDFVSHDYSLLDSDIFCPGGVGGCLWTKPFQRSGLMHIPTTLPFDDATLLNVVPEQLLTFWEPKIQWLVSCGGHLVVNTHPEPHRSGNRTMLSVYENLLKKLRVTQSMSVNEEFQTIGVAG